MKDFVNAKKSLKIRNEAEPEIEEFTFEKKSINRKAAKLTELLKK